MNLPDMACFGHQFHLIMGPLCIQPQKTKEAPLKEPPPSLTTTNNNASTATNKNLVMTTSYLATNATDDEQGK
jgi:hypothetical protein